MESKNDRTATTYLSWGGDDKFDNWAMKFRSKHTYILDRDVEDEFVRVSLQPTLETIRKLTVEIKDAHCLEKNLIFACYQASHAKNADEYAAAIARKNREILALQMNKQKESVSNLLAFIFRNRTTAVGFFNKARRMPIEGRHAVDAPASDKVDILNSLLGEYEYGLAKDVVNPVPIGVDAAFSYGPFLFDKEATDIVRREPPNVAELGLIFHLVYLFRYFTSKSTRQGSTDTFALHSEFFGEELRVQGEMLHAEGKPNYALVAILVNATFNKKYRANDMKLRLKDLLAPPSNVAKKLAGKKRYIDFAGWEIRHPT